jgi:hypothetical protein
MARTTAAKEQTFTVAVSVLAIDSNFEPATLAAFQYREKHVYPYIAAKRYAVDKCHGPMARRIYVAPKTQPAAATLESDLDILRCPSSPLAPNAWGDPNAKLP